MLQMDQRGSALKRRAPDSGFAPNPRFSGAQRLVGKQPGSFAPYMVPAAGAVMHHPNGGAAYRAAGADGQGFGARHAQVPPRGFLGPENVPPMARGLPGMATGPPLGSRVHQVNEPAMAARKAAIQRQQDWIGAAPAQHSRWPNQPPMARYPHPHQSWPMAPRRVANGAPAPRWTSIGRAGAGPSKKAADQWSMCRSTPFLQRDMGFQHGQAARMSSRGIVDMDNAQMIVARLQNLKAEVAALTGKLQYLTGGGGVASFDKKIGVSCHQCKKSNQKLVFCTKFVITRARKAFKQCRKKYCLRCLGKFYPNTSLDHLLDWHCPSCRGVCSCANCVRMSEQKKYKHFREALGHNDTTADSTDTKSSDGERQSDDDKSTNDDTAKNETAKDDTAKADSTQDATAQVKTANDEPVIGALVNKEPQEAPVKTDSPIPSSSD